MLLRQVKELGDLAEVLVGTRAGGHLTGIIGHLVTFLGTGRNEPKKGRNEPREEIKTSQDKTIVYNGRQLKIGFESSTGVFIEDGFVDKASRLTYKEINLYGEPTNERTPANDVGSKRKALKVLRQQFEEYGEDVTYEVQEGQKLLDRILEGPPSNLVKMLCASRKISDPEGFRQFCDKMNTRAKFKK